MGQFRRGADQVGKAKVAPGAVTPGVVKNNPTAKHHHGHTVHGVVVHVDHKHHVFTVRVHQNQNGGKTGQHHEQKFHVTGHTHFDIGTGKNQHAVGFAARSTASTSSSTPPASNRTRRPRVDIHKQHHTGQKAVNNKVVRK